MKIFTILTFFIFTQFQICCSSSDIIIRTGEKYYSQILEREIEYSVLLPHDYFLDEIIHYPVIYLLHGIHGNDKSWLEGNRVDHLIDSLVKLGNLGNFIYVMPSAYDSYYINNFDSSFRYMDFFTMELVPAIDSIYRTEKDRESSTLLGISMGGFGSIVLGLQHTELFGTIVSLSAAVRTEEIFKQVPQAKYDDYFEKVYGPELAGEDRITDHWKANSPYYVTDSTILASARHQNWYIDCGMDDFLLEANEAFHRWMILNNIDHDYHVRPGSHNWSYWHRSLIYALMYINEKIWQSSHYRGEN